MKFSELIPLSAATINFFLSLFVFSRDSRSLLNRIYLLWGLSITVWNLGTFFLFRVSNEREAVFWAHFLQFGVIFLPVTLLHLCLVLGKIPATRMLGLLYAWHGALAASNFTDFFISGVEYTGYAFYSTAGPGFWIFLFSYVLVATTTVWILWSRLRAAPPLHRMRLKSLLWANGILILFGNNDLLPILGQHHYPGTQTPIYPLGSAAAIVYGLIVGYSVLQHQLLDIHVTLGRLAARAVRLLFFLLIGLSLLLVLKTFFPEQFRPFAFYGCLGVLLVTAVIASNLFPRLFGVGGDALERRILGDRFEYHDKIQGFIQSIPWYADVNLLLEDFDDLLVKTVRVSSYQIILLEEVSRVFSLFRSFPEQPRMQFPDIHLDSPIFEYFQNRKVEYLTFDPTSSLRGETLSERAARRQLKLFNPQFCFPFFAGDDPFGILLLGEKTSGEPYTPHDLHLLTLLVKNLSLIINQIRLKKQVSMAEELELIGRMSRGMAHDLNNLLTPVSTLLQLLREDLLDAGKSEELLPVALRNVGTMQSYIREALFFSQNHTPRLEPGRLDLVIHKAVATAEPAWRRKEMEVAVSAPEEVVVEMDSVLIQRLVANLLSNAIDASPPKSKINVELQRLARTEANRDWLRIRIIDEGEGIKREHLKRIFKPYFTTKDHGDETRGFGLGLAICRQIVHLHCGNLNIASEEKKGTTVQVDLPSRQINRHAPAPALHPS